MSFSNATKVFMVSILAVPATYGFNTVMTRLKWECGHPLWIVGTAAVILTAVMALIVWMTNTTNGTLHPSARKAERIYFCIFSILSFTGVISLIIGLELDGLVSGFVGVFLKTAEPYLRSSHGVMVSYWHGTGAYAMYLMMIAAITWNNEFYEVALFWLGSSINTMLVLILGVLTGKHGLTWGSVFYIPYILIPPLVVLGLHQQRHRQNQVSPSSALPLRSRPVDIIFIVYLIGSAVIALFRGLAVLDSKIGIINDYIKEVEPYIEYQEPAPFPKIQMLVYLFHFVPAYCVIIYGLLKPGCHWIPELTLVHAGAALQAQVTHIGASLHARTPYVYRVPPEMTSRIIFWTVNLVLAVGPQLLAYRCTDDTSFFERRRRRSPSSLGPADASNNHNVNVTKQVKVS